MFKIPVSISVHYSSVLIFPLLRLDILVAVNMKVVVCTAVLQFGCICADIMSVYATQRLCTSYMLLCQLHPVYGALVDCTYECACMHPCTHACAQRTKSVTLGFCILIPISTASSGLKL
jgi:hypothetical protein